MKSFSWWFGWNKARGLYVTLFPHLALRNSRRTVFAEKIDKKKKIGAQLGHSDWLDLPLDQHLCIIIYLLNTHRQPASGVYETSQGSFTIREPDGQFFLFFNNRTIKPSCTSTLLTRTHLLISTLPAGTEPAKRPIPAWRKAASKDPFIHDDLPRVRKATPSFFLCPLSSRICTPRRLGSLMGRYALRKEDLAHLIVPRFDEAGGHVPDSSRVSFLILGFEINKGLESA